MKRTRTVLYTFILFFAINLNAQTKDSIAFNTSIGLTNNGISNVPNFSLSKPAITFDFSISKGRFSFDPIVYFSTTMKPWQNGYWLHYKLIEKKKIIMKAGLALNYSYSYASVIMNNIQKSLITGNSYFNADFSITYLATKHFSITPFYLYGKGLEQSAAGTLHYIALVTSYQDLNLGSGFSASLSPQFYYLYLDGLKSYFFTTSIMLKNKKSKFNISGLINTPIGNSNTLPANFVWSVSLNYAIRKSLVYGKG